ncbi:MAG: hypothetical protein OEY51_10025 [Cyclobacteriaceae bacterium]|nr:hypothetical protein [Cyclobacteriaceae bacterium]
MRILPLTIFCLLTITNLVAQDVEENLKTAKSAYQSGDLVTAKDNLTEAITALDNILGKEILSILPGSLNDVPSVAGKDEIVTNSGIAGLFVERTYQKGENIMIELNITDDSPLVATTNALISNPVMSLITSQSGDKVVKVGSYKGILQKEDGSDDYELMVPFGNSMLSIETKGVKNESEVIQMANTIPLDKIGELLK